LPPIFYCWQLYPISDSTLRHFAARTQIFFLPFVTFPARIYRPFGLEYSSLDCKIRPFDSVIAVFPLTTTTLRFVAAILADIIRPLFVEQAVFAHAFGSLDSQAAIFADNVGSFDVESLTFSSARPPVLP
jgi:hypothetical protein